MSRICPIIAAFLMAADAAAADFNLLNLIGGETKDTSVANVTTNAVADAATNTVADTATNVVASVSTNVAANVSTNAAAMMPKKKRPVSTRPATITSRSTYYDRKDGFAVFSGSVHVDDEQYQMHADKAYVFFEGTNQLKRIVATGGVALTNGTRRAYGGKASYYRKSGMVVLYSSDNAPAEVRDEAEDRNQTVKGSKIKFWIDAEQVEVLDAQISAPAAGGIGDLKLK